MADEEASSCNTHTGLHLGLGIGLLGYHSHGQQQNQRKKACSSSTSMVSLGLSFSPPPADDEDMQMINGFDQQQYYHKSDGSNEDDGNNNNNNNAVKNERKKLRLTKDQSSLLEETFKLHPTLTPAQKQSLAEQLDLKPRQVEVWFQNRRARSKLKQTEKDCEFLKKCCESLSNENLRLKKEIQELRTLNQKTTDVVSLCPSCERNYYG